MANTKCLVVDDHSVVQQGLQLLFGDMDDLDLVGVVQTGEEAIDAVARLQPEVVVRAIRTVASGKPFVDPSLSPALLISDAGTTNQSLSEREREILQLLAEGFHTEEVARRIGLSVETVKSDTKRVIAKLQADSRTHAVAIALRRALID